MTASRGLSIALIALFGLSLLTHPEWLADGVDWLVRIGLALALAGAIGAVGHAAGHQAEGKLLQFVQSPKVAWPAIIGGIMVMAGSGFV